MCMLSFSSMPLCVLYKGLFIAFSAPGPWHMWAYGVAFDVWRALFGVRCKLFSRDALAIILTIGIYPYVLG